MYVHILYIQSICCWYSIASDRESCFNSYTGEFNLELRMSPHFVPLHTWVHVNDMWYMCMSVNESY